MGEAGKIKMIINKIGEVELNPLLQFINCLQILQINLPPQRLHLRVLLLRRNLHT